MNNRINIHCPGCGAKASADQQFCRSCGFNLQKVSQLFSQQRSVDTKPDKDGHEGKAQEWGLILVIAGIALMVLYVFGSAAYRLFDEGKLLTGLLLLITMVILTAGGLALAWSAHLKNSLKDRRKDQREALSDRLSTAKLLDEPQSELMISVTEDTTELLENRESRGSNETRKEKTNA